MSPQEKFNTLGIILPPAPSPKGVYKPCLIVDQFLYVSGHGPYLSDNSLMTGRIGDAVDMEYGKLAARQTGYAILSTIIAKLGSLDKIKRVVKILGMVNCVTNFESHPSVINGCSELFAEIWGEENGIGVRSAVGMGSLPQNISVEIEAMFELHV